jgi:hypothetical protein
VVELPRAADSCPWVGKLRTVIPLSDVIRDSVVGGGCRAASVRVEPEIKTKKTKEGGGHTAAAPTCERMYVTVRSSCTSRRNLP